jgi:hypothetical protein
MTAKSWNFFNYVMLNLLLKMFVVYEPKFIDFILSVFL